MNQKSQLVHLVGEGTYFRDFDCDAGCRGECLGNLLIRAFAIEELREHPLGRRQPEIVVLASLQNSHEGFPVKHAIADNQLRVKLWRATARQSLLRDLWKCRVESFAEVHGASRTCIVMPGFSNGDGCTTAPITCTLPLAGSTTGLTRAIRPD